MVCQIAFQLTCAAAMGITTRLVQSGTSNELKTESSRSSLDQKQWPVYDD